MGHAGDFVIRQCRRPNPNLESVNRRVELRRNVLIVDAFSRLKLVSAGF